MRKPAFVFTISLSAFLAFSGISILKSSDDVRLSLLDRAFYLSAEDGIWIRPGLKLEILNVSINSDRKPVVDFKITDELGQPLDRKGIFTPGEVNPRFLIAYLPSDADQYVNYITRTSTSPITNATAQQATSDSGGSHTALGDGIYRYTFGNSLPQNYDRTATHTIGIYATRDLREFDLSRYVANALKNFVPDGRNVTKVREVVATVNCNQCHNPLALHGGSRQETGLCILCHTPQTSDPDTGNTVDFKVMVHKIHRGEDLPSVKSGAPYQIIGYRQSVHDFSTVVFPHDIRSCESCHKNASQAANWKLEPSRATCGSCHDEVDFVSGENHAGGPQPNDNRCDSCHWAEGDFEYDASVAGAHTVPDKSTQLLKPRIEILSIVNTGPGAKPTVRFKITDRNGNAIAPASISRLTLRLAGPTTDYEWILSESATDAAYSNGIATYTFADGLPADAKGTYALGAEGRMNATLNPGTTKEFTYRDAPPNVVRYFAVTGATEPRRKVVDISKCNACHQRLQVHGSNRNDTEMCVLCHIPTFIDSGRRPEADLPNDSVHFKYMIHKLHTGEELEQGYQTGRNDRSHTRFPGDRRDCSTCHVGTSYTLPLPEGLLPTTTPRNYWNPTMPVAASCLSCHDSVEAAAHALLNTAASIGESCVVCHKEGAEFAVSRIHAR